MTDASIDFQVSYDGLLMGPETPYGITSYVGFLDLSSVRQVIVNRPHHSSTFAQPVYAGGTIFEVQLDIVATASTAFTDAVATLQTIAVSPVISGDVTLLPLTFKLPGRPVLTVWVQCLRRAIPVATGFEFGLAEKAALQFYAPDPRLYGASQTLTAGLRTGGTGLTYPLLYRLTYGDAATGGVVTFVNDGTASTEPLIVVTGPFAAGFEITHVETGRRLRYTATVGSDLVLDCAEGTALTQGQERATSLTIREWFSIPAGASATFSLSAIGGETAASSPSSGMSITVAAAYS